MKAIKILAIALLVAFGVGTVNAQTTTPVKPATEKTTHKKGHHKHHHKHKVKKAAKA